MAGELEVEVIAEGVETEAQLTIARSFGIQTIQGICFPCLCPQIKSAVLCRFNAIGYGMRLLGSSETILAKCFGAICFDGSP